MNHESLSRVPLPSFLVGTAIPFIRSMPHAEVLFDRIIARDSHNKPQKRLMSKVRFTESQKGDLTATIIVTILFAFVEMFVNHNQIYIAKVAVMVTFQQLKTFWPDSDRSLRTMMEDGIRALHYACATEGRPLGHNQFSRVLETCIPVFCIKRKWKFLDRIHPVHYLREVVRCTTGTVTSIRHCRHHRMCHVGMQYMDCSSYHPLFCCSDQCLRSVARVPGRAGSQLPMRDTRRARPEINDLRVPSMRITGTWEARRS
jgi:uncharacterized membrane protein YbaN (DUF454 family)